MHAQPEHTVNLQGGKIYLWPGWYVVCGPMELRSCLLLVNCMRTPSSSRGLAVHCVCRQL